jgi:hypothetical protein
MKMATSRDFCSQPCHLGQAACGRRKTLDALNVRDMMLGGADTFTDRGEHALKGIDGSWRIFGPINPALDQRTIAVGKIIKDASSCVSSDLP